MRKIFLVHGRDIDAYHGMMALLSSLKLDVKEWSEIKKDTEGTIPYTMEIVKKAIMDKAVLVLLTPDEVTFLRQGLQNKKDSKPVFQSRPNVLFEAGFAFSSNPSHTVIVTIDNPRIWSDIEGLHIVRFDGTSKSRKSLVDALKKAGCEVNTDGEEWLKEAGNKYFKKAINQQEESDVSVERGIPAGVRISNSPYKFEKAISDKCKRIIMTGHNFADQLEPKKGAPLLEVLRKSLENNRELEIIIVFAPPNILKEAHEVGYNDLLNTSIPQFVKLKYGSLLNSEQQKRLFICCLSGALSLTCFARDYDKDDGLITVTPRWLTDQTGGGRMFFASRKLDNEEIYETMRKQIDLIYTEIRTHNTAMKLKEVVIHLIDKQGISLNINSEDLEKLRNSND